MSTTVTTLYDNLFSVITTLFSTKVELENSYELTDNSPVMLRNGFGIIFEEGNIFDEMNFPQIYQMERSIGIILTKTVYRTDLNATAKRSVEKTLFEELYSLIKDIHQNDLITRPTEFFQFTGDGGIEQIDTDKQNIISLKANFLTRYTEVI